MEFPTQPTKRQLERQQAIASVISGLAYKDPSCAIDVDFVPEEPVVLEKTDEAQRGFNAATFQEYIRGI